MLWLILARLLIANVRFERWRGTLGTRGGAERFDRSTPDDFNAPARRLAAAVRRAASRLPGESRCLAQAMTLQWMLHVRGLGGALHFGVHPDDRAGTLDTLHAWVSRGGEVLIGDSDESYSSILVLCHEQACRL